MYKLNLKIMKAIWLFSLLAISSISGVAQSLEKSIDSLMGLYFKPNGAGAVVLVAKDGQIIYNKAFGMANLELDVPMKKEMVFEIGSMTKQFTAVSILMLLEQGKLSLDDDIKKYVENYPTDSGKVTIHNLLNHTSGIKDLPFMDWVSFSATKKEYVALDFINYAKKEPLSFKPNEKWDYSNMGYIILGYIIEKTSGMKYQDFLQKNIFDVLHMKYSYCRVGLPNVLIKNRAYGYDKNEVYYNADFLEMSQGFSAGCILSTTEDLYKWNNGLQNNTLLKKETLQKAFTNYTLNNGDKTSYGYGFLIKDINGSESFEHGGGIPGFASHGIYLANEKVYVVALSNCRYNNPAYEATNIAALVINKPFKPKKELHLDKKQASEYLGDYKHADGTVLVVSLDTLKLYVQRKDRKYIRSQLIPFEKDKFYVENEFTIYEFKRNEKKEIIELIHRTRFKENRLVKQ